jgi:hypothetical protein
MVGKNICKICYFRLQIKIGFTTIIGEMLKHYLTHSCHNLSFLTLSMYFSVVDHSNFQPLVLYTRRNHCSFSFIRMVCLLAHITLSLTHRVFFSFFHTVNFSIPLTNTILPVNTKASTHWRILELFIYTYTIKIPCTC